MTVTRLYAAIAAERQAQREAEGRCDSDAWEGATEAMNAYLDDLCALRRAAVDHGAAPALA